MPASSPGMREPVPAMPASAEMASYSMPAIPSALAGADLPAVVGSAYGQGNWISLLEAEAARMLVAGKPEVMDALGRQFESALIKTALKHTHGRKNDAAIRLGIGRNTITRKIQELGIEGGKDD